MNERKYQVVSRGVLNGHLRIWEVWESNKAAAVATAKYEEKRGWDVTLYKNVEGKLVAIPIRK